MKSSRYFFSCQVTVWTVNVNKFKITKAPKNASNVNIDLCLCRFSIYQTFHFPHLRCLNLAETSTIMWSYPKWQIVSNCLAGSSLENYEIYSVFNYIQWNFLELLFNIGKYELPAMHTCKIQACATHTHAPCSVHSVYCYHMMD